MKEGNEDRVKRTEHDLSVLWEGTINTEKKGVATVGLGKNIPLLIIPHRWKNKGKLIREEGD